MMRHNGNDLKGAMNLGVNLVNTTVTGIISSASQKYRDGLAVITALNRDELSNVTQSAAAPVNNGVVVTLDGASKWEVTGTSYVTSLTLAEGADLVGAEGKTLTMTVDGVATPVAAGTYTGVIELTVG
jgi:NADPH-dependent curcumin reductase CurA